MMFYENIRVSCQRTRHTIAAREGTAKGINKGIDKRPALHAGMRTDLFVI